MEPKKIVGALLLGVLVLWVIGWASSRSHKVGAPQVVQASPPDKWHVTEKQSPMDDSKTVMVALDSDDEVHGPLGAVRPSLIVRCQQKKTEVYVETGMAASVEEYGPSHAIGIRLDDGPAEYYDWIESGDNKALFANDREFADHGHGGIIEYAKSIAEASTLTFQFTPFDGSRQVARFDIRGLDPHLHKIAEACDWAY